MAKHSFRPQGWPASSVDLTLAGAIAWIGIRLIQKQQPRRHRAPPNRIIGACQHQNAARELVLQLSRARAAER